MVIAEAQGAADLPRAAEVLHDAVGRGAIASASAVVLVDGQIALAHTLGVARRTPWRPVCAGQVYDLASLTKALATAPAIAALAAAGRLHEDQPVHTWLADADSRVTIRQLLQHSSGLPAWAPLYKAVDRPGAPEARARVIRLACRHALAGTPGAWHIYSDLGFLQLLAITEALSGPLPAPPGLRWGDPDAAATERCPERGRVVEGVVHDMNAWSMGGRSGHAGLFGDARTVARLTRALVRGEGAWEATSAVLHRWWGQESPGSHRGGWDRPTPGGSTGGALPADAVGHLGYTGTSVWAVPSKDTVLVLLTNRIHETDDLTAIKALRPAWHRAVAADLGWPEPA